jgi:hypothetical protein
MVVSILFIIEIWFKLHFYYLLNKHFIRQEIIRVLLELQILFLDNKKEICSANLSIFTHAKFSFIWTNIFSSHQKNWINQWLSVFLTIKRFQFGYDMKFLKKAFFLFNEQNFQFKWASEQVLINVWNLD